MATYVGDEFLALYHCVRSLAVKEPFPGAENNLRLLFEKVIHSLTLALLAAVGLCLLYICSKCLFSLLQNRSYSLQSLSANAQFNFLNPSERNVTVKDRDLSQAMAVIDLWPLVVRTISFFFLKSR